MDEKTTDTCIKCGGTMSPGYVLDRSYHTVLHALWCEGPAKPGVFWEVDPSKSETWKMSGLRCDECGYLEFFANKPSTIKP